MKTFTASAPLSTRQLAFRWALLFTLLVVALGVTSPAAAAQPGNVCYDTEQFWVPGRWEVNQWGQRRFVQGHWANRQVMVPCPPIHPPGFHPGFNPAPQPRVHGPQHHMPAFHPHVAPVEAGAFNNMLHALSLQRFESTKLNVARQMINTNFFTVEQVGRLMQQFTFESSKLEVAKLAYPQTLDRHQYFMLYGQFRFSSSVDDLNRFVQQSGF
jgi:hypothetical protein